jgi:protein TonB
VRWDSPFVLATAGTLAIHVILAVGGDALVVLYPPMPDPPPAPRIEIVDVEVPPIVKPPPPPAKKQVEEPVKPDLTKPAVTHHVQPTEHVEPPPNVPPPTTPDPEPSGGAPVITEPDIAPSATGVPVAKGPRNTGHVGRGGTGTGTGSGEGSGTAELPPVSVATIKTRANPRGDFSYGLLKDYPTEAKQLGIEGQIRVKLIVDEHGAVKSATLLNRLGHGLDELALRQANLIVFDPAKDTDDRPVTSVVVWTFDLTLPK